MVNDIDSTTAEAVMHVWHGIFVDITVEVVVVDAVGNDQSHIARLVMPVCKHGGEEAVWLH